MKFITVTELKQHATEVVRVMQNSKEEVIVTKGGKPIILMRLITDEIFQLKE
jgi:prevent-host-death family protein